MDMAMAKDGRCLDEWERCGREMKNMKKRKRAKLPKKMAKPFIKIMKEKQKTFKAMEKIHRKAAKGRRKKIEKRVNGLLTAGCFLVCLAAAFWEAKKST